MAKASPPSGIDLEKAKAHIILHIKKSGGFRPNAHSGPILHGELAGLIKWEAVNRFLIRYADKNPGCGFTSLATYIDKLEKEGRLPASRPTERPPSPGKTPTPLDITNMVSIIRQTLFSGRKVLRAEKIEFGGHWRGKYWLTADNRLASYAIDNPECGFNDLKSLMEKFGIENIPAGSELPRIRPQSADEILDMTREHINLTKNLPPVRTGLLRNEFAHASVNLINKDLRNGNIEGPTSFENLLIGSGLAKSVGGMLRLTSKPQP